MKLPSPRKKDDPASFVPFFRISSSTPIHLMVSTAPPRISTLALVSRGAGACSIIVIEARGQARRSQKAKTLPAMLKPDMRTWGADVVQFVNLEACCR